MAISPSHTPFEQASILSLHNTDQQQQVHHHHQQQQQQQQQQDNHANHSASTTSSSQPNSTNASFVNANDSTGSLLDPMLKRQHQPQQHNIHPLFAQQQHLQQSQQQQHPYHHPPPSPSLSSRGSSSNKAIGALESSSPSSSSDSVLDRPRPKKKTIPPIRIPRRSEAALSDLLRSPASGGGGDSGNRGNAALTAAASIAAHGLSSAALTDSFPLPPPRTPGTPSHTGTFGSMSASGHTQRESRTSNSSLSATSSSDPTRSGRNSVAHPATANTRTSTAPTTAGLYPDTTIPVPHHPDLPQSPKVHHLPVPPPTPLLAGSSRAPSSIGGNYWEGEQSSIRETNDGYGYDHDYDDDDDELSTTQQDHEYISARRNSSRNRKRRSSRGAQSQTQEGEYLEEPPLSATRAHPLPYYSPDPAANIFQPFQEDPPSTRIKSYAAEISTPLNSLPASPAYPPRTYSPAGISDFGNGRNRMQFIQASPSPFGSTSVQATPSGGPGRGTAATVGDVPPSPLDRDHVEERNMWARRRDSAGTFGTIFSSTPSIGMTQAINTLEYEDFDSIGTRTTSHTRAHSEVSIASSPGMTHELVRRGNVFESRPASSAAFHDNSRRLARASLISSQMLRSPNSVDALKSALLDDPAYKVDKDEDLNVSRPPTRARYSNRYSSGPAPTLASLAEDDDDPYLPPSSLSPYPSMRKSRSRNGNKRPSSHASRRNSNWGNKSSRSVASHRSGQSSAHFTVASHAPSLPTLHKAGKRAEIATEEAALPFKKLARRASTLGEILDNKPEQDQYISYPSMGGSRDASYDDLEELKYSNQLRKARRKVGMGIPSLWGSQTPPMQQQHLPSPPPPVTSKEAQSDMKEVFQSERPYHVHPAADIDSLHFRRRKSYPASQLESVISSRSMHTEKAESSALHGRSSFSSSISSDSVHGGIDSPQKNLSFWKTMPPQKKRKVKLAAILLIVLLVAIGIGAAIPLSKHSDKDGSSCERDCSSRGTALVEDDKCTCKCEQGFAGPYCELDATCVCPDGSSSCAQTIAKSVLSAASYASTLFAPAVNATRFAALLATDPTSCSGQTRFIETPNLDPSQYKSRRRWIQAALLWDIAISEDFDHRTLSDFQSGLSYWQWQDSPSFQAQPTFQTTVHGYTFDFAFQKVVVPPKALADLGINSDAARRLDNITAQALQHVGAFAVAASTQRTTALEALFKRLQYSSDQLSSFISGIQAAPIVVPFDVSASIGSQAMLSLAEAQADNGRGFPMPSSCMPGLQGQNLDSLNAVESTIFGLEEAITLNSIRMDCLNRPLYGFLNVFNLRTAFLQPERPGQAVVIASQVSRQDLDLLLYVGPALTTHVQSGKSRVTVTAGSLLTPLVYGGSVNTSRTTSASFGSLNQMQNVLFDWLSGLPDESVLKALIDYILSGSRAPPDPDSELYTRSNFLQAIPDIEAQLWGGMLFSDIDYVVSNVALPSGNSLFGTSLGSDFRKWAHRDGANKPIRWTSGAATSQYALDTGGDAAFQTVWDASGSSSASDVFNRLSGAKLLTS